MPPDLERYRRYVDGFALSEQEKVELLRTVWRIMESFVDRAFGLDPVQLCLPADRSKRASGQEITLHYDQRTRSFNTLTGAFQQHAGKRRRKKR